MLQLTCDQARQYVPRIMHLSEEDFNNLLEHLVFCPDCPSVLANEISRVVRANAQTDLNPSATMVQEREPEIDCAKVRENTNRYILDQLPPERKALFDEHIRNCDPCAKHLGNEADAAQEQGLIPAAQTPPWPGKVEGLPPGTPGTSMPWMRPPWEIEFL